MLLSTSVSHAGEFWMTMGGPREEPGNGMMVAVDLSTLVDNGPERKAWIYLVSLKGGGIAEVTGLPARSV